jgi:hypothetical protein
MDHITTRLMQPDTGDCYYLNLFAHSLDKNDTRSVLEKQKEISLVEKVISSFAKKDLYLTTREGSINLGKVLKARFSHWGDEDIPNTVTGTLFIEMNDATNYIYSRGLKINSILIPTGSNHLTPIVYLNEYLNNGLNYNLAEMVSLLRQE